MHLSNRSENKKEKLLECIQAIKTYGLNHENVEIAFQSAWACGHLFWFNSVGIYRDDSFEQTLIRRFLDKDLLLKSKAEKGQKKNRVLHIISTPYAMGGHTRLMERLISSGKMPSDVLVTRPFSGDDGALSVDEFVHVFCSNSQYSIEEMAAIIFDYDFIAVHIHPDDIRGAVAIGLARKNKKIRSILVNHADHAFSFGYSIVDRVAEVSTCGYKLNQEKRMISSSFMGIPVEKGNEFSPCKPCGEPLTIVSAASAYKYRPAIGFSFPFLAGKILKEIKTAKITVIGAELKGAPYWWWLKIRYPKRFSIYPVVPYLEYKERVQSASIYLDSLPLTGGTILPEVRALGVMVAGIQTGVAGTTPFDNIKSSDVDTLVAAIKGETQGEGELTRRNNDRELWAAASKNHSITEVADRFHDIMTKDSVFLPMTNMDSANIEFYEKIWDEAGVVHFNGELLALVLGWPWKQAFPILLKIYAAMGWRDRFRLIRRVIRHRRVLS